MVPAEEGSESCRDHGRELRQDIRVARRLSAAASLPGSRRMSEETDG